jgi:hypothetical protein
MNVHFSREKSKIISIKMDRKIIAIGRQICILTNVKNIDILSKSDIVNVIRA